MAVLLMKLRHVPEDELIEILRLLDEHEVDYYQTSAGAFGISLPGLWLRDESRTHEVKSLLDDYADQRREGALDLQALQIATRGKRTVGDMFWESPGKFTLRVLLIGFLLWFSVRAFLP